MTFSVTQGEVSEIADSSEVTIRDQYKELLDADHRHAQPPNHPYPLVSDSVSRYSIASSSET